MSFLNPVNEPVLRFSSTDVGAPQINYNARVAGDIKTVLKGCLVTGYGAKASARWSVVNEVDHVAEFVSPSAAMSDYRLGVDDTSASSTTWYYQYQDVRVNPSYNKPVKAFTTSDNTHVDNGWQLFVTERGVLFVELVQHISVNKLSARITYWGQVKSALNGISDKNMFFFNIGHNAQISSSHFFYNDNRYIHAAIGTHTSIFLSTASGTALSAVSYKLSVSVADLVGSIYITNSAKDALIAELPPMLSKIVNQAADLFGVREFNIDGRNTLSVCIGYAYNDVSTVNSYARTFLIPLDYWEY